MAAISWTRVVAGGMAAFGIVAGLFVLAIKGYNNENRVASSYTDPATQAHYRAMNELAAYESRRGLDDAALSDELKLSKEELVTRVEQWLQANPNQPADQTIYDSLKLAPGHFYNFKDHGAYGYKEAGGSNVVKFVRFMGTNQQGRHVFQMEASNAFIEMWCEGNCELVHANQVTVHGFGAVNQDAQVFNPERGTILWSIVHDMLTGKMDPDGA